MTDYKQYTVDKKTNKLILEWRIKDYAEFTAVKNYVKDTLKGIYQFKTKQWICPATSTIIDALRAAGWTTPEDRKQNRTDALDTKWADFPQLPTIPDYRSIKLNESYLPSTIRSYQREAIQFIEARNGRTVIALPAGSGKTLLSCAYVASKSWNKPVLLVCPAGLKTHWKNEFKKWSKIKAT